MPRAKTRTDDEVLAAMAVVLARSGPHDFTLADVAAATHLAPATLLQRFGSKRGLMVAFARWAAERADGPFQEAEQRGGPPLVRLRRALLALAGPAGNRREFGNHLALLLEDMRDPELRRAAAQHAERIEGRIAALLREATSAGGHSGFDPGAWARVVFAAWNGALIQWGLRGRGPLAAWLDNTLGPLLRAPGLDRHTPPSRARAARQARRRPNPARGRA